MVSENLIFYQDFCNVSIRIARIYIIFLAFQNSAHPSLTKEAAVSSCLEKLFQLASGLSYLQVRVTRATAVCRRLMLDE